MPKEMVLGRARIAEMLGRSERTISRWIKRGVLPATKAGPFDNNLLRVSMADIRRLSALPADNGA